MKSKKTSLQQTVQSNTTPLNAGESGSVNRGGAQVSSETNNNHQHATLGDKASSGKLLLPIAVLALVAGAMTFGIMRSSDKHSSFIGVAHADTTNTQSESSIIQRLASRFNINQSDVEQVFKDHRSAMHAQREENIKAHFTARLQSLVDGGKITGDQKTAIENKFQEIHERIETERKSWQDSKEDWVNKSQEERQKAREERKAKIDDVKKEIDQWLSDQGIDKNVIGSLFPIGGRGDFGSHGNRGEQGERGGRGDQNKTDSAKGDDDNGMNFGHHRGM